mgnify:CR=1 FL=1
MDYLEKKKITILFDGVCNMCVGSIKFIIQRDSKDNFRFASIQSKVGKELLKKHQIDIKKTNSIIVINNDNLRFRSSAVLYILTRLNTLWRCLLIFYLIPYPIRDFMYFLIAKSRYFLFGKKDDCMIPSESIKSKFLSL